MESAPYKYYIIITLHAGLLHMGVTYLSNRQVELQSGTK